MQEHAPRPSVPPVPPRVLRRALLASMKAVLRMWALCRLRVPPEAVAVADVLRASPELAAALRDPHVLAMLRDPATRRELAQILLVAAHGSSDAASPHHVH